MDERWVCTRCFTSNPGDVSACPNCGTPRASVAQPTETPAAAPPAGAPSAEPTAPPGWAPPESRSWSTVAAGAPRKRSPWLAVGGVVIGLVAIGAVVYGFMSTAQRGEGGEITEGGTLEARELEVGDCFDVGSSEEEIFTVDAVPCADPHVYEAYWVGSAPDGDYPSDDEFFAFAEDTCITSFEEYVNFDFQTSVWFIDWFAPTAEAWGQGERAFVCFLFNSTETPVSGSARGSAR